MSDMSENAERTAVVLGGSIAGLLAAKVLAESGADVTVVDRDLLADVDTARRGVPQGRHTHGLLARGQQVLEELFPGLTGEMQAAGVEAGDLGSQLRWIFDGRQLAPAESGLLVVGGYRPVIEYHVRRRVAKLPNVRFLEEHDIVGLVTDEGGKRVVGARVQQRGAGTAAEVLPADLVVDATGKGSRTPSWLTGLGYPQVAEERVKIGLTYTSCRFALTHDPFGDDVSVNPVATPAHPRGGFLTKLSDHRCIVSLTGVLGDQAPTDPEGFVEYARSLPVPDIHEAIRDAQPLEEASTFRYPASIRRRYERLDRFPESLVVLGDAVCSFNPVYGQGITVAALQALTLRRHLRTGGPISARAYFRDISRVLDAPWEIAAGGDLGFPGAEGRRTLKSRISTAFTVKLHAAASVDPAVTAAFVRVAGLVDPPTALMRPSFALRVLRGARKAAPLPSPATPASPPSRKESEG
jgi:2-polyprenyl-6-methoxyphenol hydroxylase-like FAD-dependent oxidoreductase